MHTNAQKSPDTLLTATTKYIPVKSSMAIPLGSTKIIINVSQYGNDTSIVLINLHSNESTSVKAAVELLSSKGGKLIKLENNDQRLVKFSLKNVEYEFDPNRIFTKVGMRHTLRQHKNISKPAIAEVEKFAATILKMIPSTTNCVIALHNNTDGNFSIKSYMSGSSNQSDAKAVYQNKQVDIDDFILTTNKLLYEQMANQKFNSVLQNNKKAKDDGSLSVYMGWRDRKYINIETEHGKEKEYYEMLLSLFNILQEAK